MQVIKVSKVEQAPIAVVVSRFNNEVTDELLKGCVERLNELEINSENITVLYVPGCIEIPLAAQRLARSNKHKAVIVLGSVVRGETSHYDYVCEQVSQGCQRVMLDESIPVIFGVLTTDNSDQAKARVGGSHGHKGRDAADAAIEIISVLHSV